MDSSGFHTLVKNFTNLTEAEFSEVSRLSKEYPYSQLLYLLNARAAQDLQSADRAATLNQAAVYSTDRTILKWVMTTSQMERETKKEVEVKVEVNEVVVVEAVKKEVLKAKPAAPIHQAPAPIEILTPPPSVAAFTGAALTGDALRNDIYVELEKLQKNKHNFEVSFDQYQKSSHAEKGARGNKNFKEPVIDPLVEEIKSTKKKFKVDSPKQLEQNEIIDKFIKIQPVIAKPKPSGEASDLSEDSAILSDNIVSETLVDILIKQGKNDKAIEVLKKLIWKFPQKKAYFAAQIENLKN